MPRGNRRQGLAPTGCRNSSRHTRASRPGAPLPSRGSSSRQQVAGALRYGEGGLPADHVSPAPTDPSIRWTSRSLCDVPAQRRCGFSNAGGPPVQRPSSCPGRPGPAQAAAANAVTPVQLLALNNLKVQSGRPARAWNWCWQPQAAGGSCGASQWLWPASHDPPIRDWSAGHSNPRALLGPRDAQAKPARLSGQGQWVDARMGDGGVVVSVGYRQRDRSGVRVGGGLRLRVRGGFRVRVRRGLGVGGRGGAPCQP